jgi:DNA-binding transcriptional MerR regulator
MAYKEFELKKLYYSIGEVAELFKVNTSLIRFWETEFDILTPKKKPTGARRYTAEDIENIQLIFHLVKEKGYTLDGAKVKIKEGKDDIIKRQKMIVTLNRLKLFLDNIKETL